MKREEIAGIPVGPELDRAVAERVMGHNYDRYSTDIAAAWEVVEHLRREGWLVVVKEMPDGYPFLVGGYLSEGGHEMRRRAVCDLSWMHRNRSPEDTTKYIHHNPWYSGESVPEAICRAALLSVAEW